VAQASAGQPPRETAKAAQAFADYVAMGPTRSLRHLADRYVQRNLYKTTTVAFRSLAEWSRIHGWQAKLSQAVTDRTLALLAEASELDAETYLAASREYRRRTGDQMIQAFDLADLHPVRDRVKPTAGRGPGVVVNVTLLAEAQKLAAQLGIPAGDLVADAERIAAAAWGDD